MAGASSLFFVQFTVFIDVMVAFRSNLIYNWIAVTMQQQNFSGVVGSNLIDWQTLCDTEVKTTDGVFVYMDFIRDLYRIVSGSLALSFDGIIF